MGSITHVTYSFINRERRPCTNFIERCNQNRRAFQNSHRSPFAFQLGRTPNFYREYCEELLLKESSVSEDGGSSAPVSRTPSPSDDDMVNDLVFHVTVEIKEEDRDRELIYEI